MNYEDLEMRKRLHDTKQSLRIIANLLELIDCGYDFSTEEGQEILAEVNDSVNWLAKALNVDFQIMERRKPAGS